MYIVFEGIDGAGKSTQINLLKYWLEENGFDVETVVEPTDSKVGKLIREILQRPDATTDRIQKHWVCCLQQTGCLLWINLMMILKLF